MRWRDALASRGCACSFACASAFASGEDFGLRMISFSAARFAAYFCTISARRFSRSTMFVLAMPVSLVYLRNGKLKASSSALPALSFFAVVVMVMSIPRSWSIWSYWISGKMICSFTPRL